MDKNRVGYYNLNMKKGSFKDNPGIRTVIDKCSEIAGKYFDSFKIILYGSRARGDFLAESDWDIIVLSPNEPDKKTLDEFRNDVYFEVELDMNSVITAFVYSYEYWNKPLFQATPFHKNVEKEGIIYEH